MLRSLLTFVAAATPARAELNTWAPIGPLAGGSVSAIAADPTNPSTLYASFGYSNGLFKSLDGGATWSRSPANDLGYRSVREIVVDPSAPATVYVVVGGVWKSTDGASSFRALSNPFDITPLALVLDPTAPSTIYLGGLYGAPVKSVDGGDTWQGPDGPDPFPSYEVVALAIDRSNPSILFAATPDGVARSVDGGRNWVLSNAGLTPWQGQVTSLATDPGAPGTVYAGTRSAGVFRSRDGGVTWSQASTGLMDFQITALAVDPNEPSAVYAATGSGTPASGLYRSTDSGATWRLLQGNAAAVSFATDARRPATLYLGTQQRGILKGAGGGTVWTQLPGAAAALSVTSVAVTPQSPPTVFAATDGGLFRSADGGSQWTAVPELPFAIVAAVDPSVPTTVYAGTTQALGSLLKSTDGGTTWLTTGLSLAPGDRLLSMAIDPLSPNTVYAGTRTNGVWISKDGARTWRSSTVDAAASNPSIPCLAVDPKDPATVYACANSGLYASTDRGTTWTALGAELMGAVTSLAIDPADPAVLYTVTGKGVYRSSDRGRSWLASGNGLPFTLKGVSLTNALAVDPVTTSTLYAAAGAGVYRSLDAGATWVNISRGLTNSFVQSVRVVAIDPISPTTLYAGTAFGSVYKGTFTGFGAEVCTRGQSSLCLGPSGRFRVEASFRSGGPPQPSYLPRLLTDSTGAFWFFDSENLEVVLKILDGRSVNGHFWVFYGALTNVEYTITVTDTETGAVKTYFNPQGQLASVADTGAF